MPGLERAIQSTFRHIMDDRRVQLRYGAFLLLFLSLVFSLGSSAVSFFGWIAMGLMGFLLIYKLLERYFFVALWLSGIYLLMTNGCLVMFHFAHETGNWFLTVLGLSMAVGAVIAGLILVYFVKERRDMIALEGQYVNIGLWWPSVIAFLVFSFWSMVGFVRWADGTLGYAFLFKSVYFLSEIILIALLIYITNFLEERLVTPAMGKIRDEGALKNLLNSINGARAVFRSIPDREGKELKCPVCTRPLKRQIRNCPSCDSPRYFYWCDRSEEFFIRCPNCMELTPIGRTRCIECSIKMSNSIRCSRCKAVNSVRGWVVPT